MASGLIKRQTWRTARVRERLLSLRYCWISLTTSADSISIDIVNHSRAKALERDRSHICQAVGCHGRPESRMQQIFDTKSKATKYVRDSRLGRDSKHISYHTMDSGQHLPQQGGQTRVDAAALVEDIFQVLLVCEVPEGVGHETSNSAGSNPSWYWSHQGSYLWVAQSNFRPLPGWQKLAR